MTPGRSAAGPRRLSPAQVLAGDVGGTKTLVGLFERGDRRPRSLAVFTYPTAAFGSFTEILTAFVRDVGRSFAVDAAAVGVAGPVVGERAHLTNIEWNVSADEIGRFFGTPRARLVNDLEALANSAEMLGPDEVVLLQEGIMRPDGNAVVIAAGTGLGQAYLHRVGGRLRPLPSEGGHADFAPRTDREIELLRILRADFGRVEVEHILSGPGLLNLHRFTHGREACGEVSESAPERRAAAISEAAMAARCPACVEALSIFVSVYGAEAGNLALRGVAASGVYIGGGIAPKILPALRNGLFIDAFRAKGDMSAFLSRTPVKVILNPEAGLLGAAMHAQELLDD
ncbi:MAG TPA: glucokinase [Vicinamibacterales bacterium]